MKHDITIAPDSIVLISRERLHVYRVSCSCGFVSRPCERHRIAEHVAKDHLDEMVNLEAATTKGGRDV
jgi:hypothetical protein